MLPLPEYLATLESYKAYGGLHITDGADRILQLRNLDGRWQNPGGDVNIGETPAQAAERETLEETGIAVDAGRLLAVLVLPAVNGWPCKIGFVFDGGDIEDTGLIVLRPDEHTDYRFAPLEQWRDEVREWTWQRLVACEQARTGRTTGYLDIRTEEAIS